MWGVPLWRLRSHVDVPGGVNSKGFELLRSVRTWTTAGPDGA